MYDLTTQQVPVATGLGLNTFEQIDIISQHFPSKHHQRFQSIYNKSTGVCVTLDALKPI